jgi:CheY-like chemotaxis protein
MKVRAVQARVYVGLCGYGCSSFTENRSGDQNGVLADSCSGTSGRLVFRTELGICVWFRWVRRAGGGARHGEVVSAQDQRQVRVLVVDDSEVFRNVLWAVVAAASGFEVVGSASSGREAVFLVDELAPHLVLLDLQMPDLDGIETAVRIRRHHPEVVVLLLTATRRASLNDLSLTVGDKRDLSAEWLAEFWQRHGSRQ